MEEKDNKKKRIIKFLAGISLFSLLYILGDNFILHKIFYNFVPGFDNFRYIGRFGLVLAFSFSLLGGYGFDYFIKNVESDKVKKFIRCFIVLLSAFIMLWLLYQIGFFKDIADAYKDEEFYSNSTIQLLKTVIILLALLALIFLYKKKVIVQQISLLFFILLSFGDLYIFGLQQNNNPYGPEKKYVNRGIATQIRQDYNDELYRVNSVTKENIQIFENNQGMLDFIFLIDGYTSLDLKDKFPPFRRDELMNVKYSTVIDGTLFFFELNENYAPRAWMSYYPIVESSLEKVAEILEDTTFDIVRKVIIDQEPEVYINKAFMGGGVRLKTKSYLNLMKLMKLHYRLRQLKMVF